MNQLHLINIKSFLEEHFERREKNCFRILINHKQRKTKGEQRISLEMAQYLKSKNFKVKSRERFMSTMQRLIP